METYYSAEASSNLLQFSLVLEHGVGISLINSVPEELLFATLSGIRVSGDMSLLIVTLLESPCIIHNVAI